MQTPWINFQILMSPSESCEQFRLKKLHWQSCAVFQGNIPGMLPKLEEMLGAMYKKCRRVLKRGQSPTARK